MMCSVCMGRVWDDEDKQRHQKECRNDVWVDDPDLIWVRQ
jgi:hypothetical protein